ncbi:putative reverse transcriptase (RNA-dependent DNA polymerase), partial [Trifolium medium]|nr:putative reverse transcriptase (RNA-dependent DNA polymerase) [Trifolium medium]
MDDCKPMNTPMHPTSSLSKIEAEGKVDQKLYRDPRESHLTVVKRIFRYLKGTTNLGLFYKKSNDYRLSGFCDADYAGDRIERKSTSGNCQFVGDNLIPWASKRQTTIALSTAEAEYISAAKCCTQLLW